jgi:hypothetical protein
MAAIPFSSSALTPQLIIITELLLSLMPPFETTKNISKHCQKSPPVETYNARIITS